MVVLSPLHRKLLRELWQIKGQVVAISLVIAAGLAMFVAYYSNFQSLQLTLDAYYDRQRFADVFAGLKRAPQRLQQRITEIPGVARVDTRVVADVTLDVPDLAEPAVGRLISIPEHGEPPLNAFFLRRGRLPEPDRPDEVLVSEGFAEVHGLESGSQVGAIINGRRRDLRIVGVALSPEYVYTIRPGELFPDDTRFGIFWMERRALAAAFDMEGGFNDVTLRLMRGASEAEVITRLDRLLAPYGGLGAVPRELQLSHWTLANEIKQLKNMGAIIPLIFLSVAAFLLNVVLSRIIAVQREEIAALKALGYSNFDVGLHYVEWGLTIALLGSAFGLAGGAWMGSALARMYAQYFRFPLLQYRLSLAVVVAAVAIALVASTLGALGAVRRAVRLPPAEAMRPEPPARYHRTFLESVGLKAWLGPAARMVLRNLERRPLRAGVSVLGIGCAVALLVVGLFFIDSMDEMLDLQFNVAQRQDVTLTFVEPTSARALHEVARLPGVMQAEPLRGLAVRLRNGYRSRQVGLQGIPQDASLQRIVGASFQPVTLPPEGLVMSAQLAKVLGVAPADMVTVEVLEGTRPVRRVRVTGVVEDFMGTAAYMELGALHRMMREGNTLSGAQLMVDSTQMQRLFRRAKLIPGVAALTIKRAALDNFQKTMGENLNVMIFFNVLFACIIAFGVVYNAARISLSERSRELASLRVLGFTRAEISAILLGELATVTLLAVPVGLWLGYLLSAGSVALFETELYRFPLVVNPATYATAAGIVALASLLSGLVVRRRLDRLDLVAVLKTRE